MEWTNDPVRDFARWEAEQTEKMERLPECDCCGRKCREYYDCFGHIICIDCIDDFRCEVEEYI